MSKRARTATLVLIAGLALADVAGALYMRQLWQERHGSATESFGAAGVEQLGSSPKPPSGVRPGAPTVP